MKGSDVTIQHVSKCFGKFEALKDVSFEIKKGEFFSLLGPSGCGKTTLLRIIAGFDFPDAGEVTIEGVNVLPLPPNKRSINTVFQNYALFPHLSIFENVAFSLRLKNAPEKEIKEKVAQYLKLVELADHAHKKPSKLSGGQKQRVAIARALINEPSVLLLDEPLSALDAKLRQQMLIELDTIHDKIGITFIYVTHDQQEALSISDRIAVMNHGEVLQIGSPHEIYESPKTEFVAKFIGETNLFSGTVQEIAPYSNGTLLYTLDVESLGTIKVTCDQTYQAGDAVSYTIRPEKIAIGTQEPSAGSKLINTARGKVDEPIYSGFSTKYFVKLENALTFKVIKQHANYSDQGPSIKWKDDVWLSWSADDGYIVGKKHA